MTYGDNGGVEHGKVYEAGNLSSRVSISSAAQYLNMPAQSAFFPEVKYHTMYGGFSGSMAKVC